MRHAILFALAIPAITAAAPYPYTLSGDRFVKMMSGVTERPNDVDAYMQREKRTAILMACAMGRKGPYGATSTSTRCRTWLMRSQTRSQSCRLPNGGKTRPC